MLGGDCAGRLPNVAGGVEGATVHRPEPIAVLASRNGGTARQNAIRGRRIFFAHSVSHSPLPLWKPLTAKKERFKPALKEAPGSTSTAPRRVLRAPKPKGSA